MVGKLESQAAEERDFIELADAMDEMIAAQDALANHLAQFVTDPPEHSDKIAALEELSQDEYEAISRAIMNPEIIEEGEENPTE